MKIAFVSQPLGSFVLAPGGSIDIWTYEVARRLARDHEVVVYARAGVGEPDEERLEGVEIERVHVATELRPIRAASRRILRLARLLGDDRPAFASDPHYWSYALQVAIDARSRGCDVIHVQNFAQFVPVLRLLNPRATIVLHMHCEWLAQLDRRAVARRLRHVDLVLGCSDFIAGGIRRAFPEVKVSTVANGVDLEHFSPGPDHEDGGGPPRRLLFAGRITPEKGVHVLLDAFAQLAPSWPDCELEVVGPPWQTPAEYIVGLSHERHVEQLAVFYDGDEDYLSRMKARLPPELRPRVHFRGLIGREELPAYYRSADFLVNPALSESFGMTILESMACNTPVVATSVGGVPELVRHGETGLLVAPGDSAALAQSLLRAAADRAAVARLATAARASISPRFTWDAISEEVMRRYRSC